MEFLKVEAKNYLKIVENTKSQTTYKTYNTVLNDALKYIEIDNNRLSISGYRMKIASQSRKTIAKKVSILRSFFKYLESKGYDFRIIGDDQISVPKSLPKPIPLDKIKETLKIANLVEYTIIMTIFGLGLRISESRNIELENIHENWITITGKGNKTRDIPLEPHLKNIIKKYIEIYSPKKYLFERKDIKMSDSQIRYIITNAFKKIGIKATPHQLRHSFATEMLNNGARINDVSELLGHEFISTTQIYTKLNSSTKLNNYLKAHPLCSQ